MYAAQLAVANAAASPEQRKHNTIVANPVFAGAISAMPTLDANTLWWMVQWGNEYLARFKRDATPARKQAHARYKKWTSDTRQKQIAGFTASLRARTGDDSFDQE
jgi:murein L,D-transpeptidase YafK